MSDVTQQRDAIAQTRARIDARLEELTDHVPARDDLTAVATKYASAVGGIVVGIVLVAIVTKSKLSGRRTDKEARTFAAAVVKGLPQLAATLTPPPAINTGPVVVKPRSLGTALLMGMGVVGGVGIAQTMDKGRG